MCRSTQALVNTLNATSIDCRLLAWANVTLILGSLNFWNQASCVMVQIVEGSIATVKLVVKPLVACLSSQQASWLLQSAQGFMQLAAGAIMFHRAC